MPVAVRVPPQLSTAVAVPRLTPEAAHVPVVLLVTVLTLAGQDTVGASLSLTVTVNEQLGPAVVLQVIVVVPIANIEPEAGVQVTVPHPVAVGVE